MRKAAARAPSRTSAVSSAPAPALAPFERRARLAAILTIAVATTVLLVIAVGLRDTLDYQTETDFLGGYVEGARGIQRGEVEPARYQVIGPVYEVVLALAGAVVRDLPLAGRLISVASAGGILLLWFLMLERRAGAVLALGTVVFLAVTPAFVRYGAAATTDALATFVQAAALFTLLGRHGGRAPLVAGVLAGVAVLTRYNAIYLLPVLFVSDAWRGAPGGRARARVALAFAAGFAAVAAPWVLFSLAHGVVPGGALFHNVAYDVLARSQGISWDEYASRIQPGIGSLGDVIAHHGAALGLRLLDNAWRHALLDLRLVIGAPVALLCGLGFVLALRDGAWRRLWPVWAAGAALYATLIPVFHSERYSLALAPFYLTLAGAALASPRLAFRPRAWSLPAKWALALLPLVVTIVAAFHDERAALHALPREVRGAAAALRSDAGRPGRPSRVLARKPHVAFYSGSTHVAFPIVASLSELATFCRREGVDYIYFSTPEIDLRPELTYLLDAHADVPGLVPLEFTSLRPARLYRIEANFGATPAWFASDSARSLRVERALRSIDAPGWRSPLVSGLYALEHEDYAAAATHFTALARMRPDFAQAHFLAGEAFRGMGEIERARAAYSLAVSIEPGHAEARWARDHVR